MLLISSPKIIRISTWGRKAPITMLDVHPPEHVAHTWRDFFLHIATIVVGLLIAVSLEQSVEYFHHRNEVNETREALRKEHERNATISKYTVGEYRRISAALQTNLAIFLYLQQHPGAPPEQWPGKLNWSRWTIGPDQAAWEIAQKSNVLSYMPQAEVRRQTDYYHRMDSLHAAQSDFADAVVLAQSLRIREPDPSHMTPAQIDKEIDLLTNALFLHIKEGGVAVNANRSYPDFASPSRQEIYSIMHYPAYTVDPEVLKSADQLKRILDKEDATGGDKP
jgi:hypothetical protein